MIPFLITGIAVFAFFIIVFFMIILDKFKYTRAWIPICAASFVSGVVLITTGCNIHAQNVNQTFINESETTQIAGLTYHIHKIDPEDQEQLRRAKEIIKSTNTKILFYNEKTYHVYKLTDNELQPYFINEHETVYENGKVTAR